MSCVLYYSKYCENCKKILYELGKSDFKKNVHFLSIDKRRQRDNKIYIVLDNGHEIFLPPNITSVPTLLLLDKNNKLLVGQEVFTYLAPKMRNEKYVATRQNGGEPLAFSTYEMGSTLSDNYSYLDQSPQDMNAKGNGGMRQMHSFVSLGSNQQIYTPDEDYVPDKVGEIDISKLRSQRQQDVESIRMMN